MPAINRVSDLGTQGFRNIFDGSIQTADIANNAITQAKLDTSIPLSGMRNLIINGAMDIWQRGTGTVTPAQGTYTNADRWVSTGVSTSFSIQTDVPTIFKYSLGVSGSDPTFGQKIEAINAVRLAGKTVTISFWAKSIAGSTSLFINLYFPNSSDNFASLTTISSTTISNSPSSSWTRYTFTTTLPTNVSNGLYVLLGRSSGTSNTYYTGIQVEEGPQATPYEHRLYGLELVLCQRYYETSNGVVQVTAGGTGFGGNTYFNWIPYKVEKRIALNLVTNNTSNGVRVFATDGGADYITMWRAATQYYSVNENFEIWTTQGFGINTTSGQTDAGLGRFYWNANAEL